MHTAYEYSEIPLNFKSKLKDSNLKNRDKIFKNGKTKHYCGMVHCGGESLLILPKIEKENEEKNLKYLLYMLLYSQNMSNLEAESSFEVIRSEDILEFFISIFANNLFREIERGFYREYLYLQENLRCVKGKILPIQDARRNFTREKIFCEFDEFTPDNRLNQFFYFATEQFTRITKNSENRRSLKNLMLVFDEVSLFRISKKELHAEMRFSRINERFKKHYDLALFILDHLIFDFEDAKNLNYSFVFDMNRLFERFVAKAFKESLGAKLQKEVGFGELKIYPDIVLESQKIVIDTKYKIVRGFPRGERQKGEVSYGDIYQMFAYCKALGYKGGNLLFPKHLVDLEESLELADGVMLYAKSLDLSSCDLEFEAYIETIKTKCGEIIDELT